MKATSRFLFMCILFVLACDHVNDDKKNCSSNDAAGRMIILCQTLPAEADKRQSCINAAVASSCAGDNYWKEWGCQDGLPCM